MLQSQLRGKLYPFTKKCSLLSQQKTVNFQALLVFVILRSNLIFFTKD